MNFYELIGIVGATFVLIAFLLTNYKHTSDRTLADEWLNLLGSIFLVIYAISGKAYPFIILNTVWALWSLKVLLDQTLFKQNASSFKRFWSIFLRKK